MNNEQLWHFYNWLESEGLVRPWDDHNFFVRYQYDTNASDFNMDRDLLGIATRYAKKVGSFTAAVQIGCIALWFKIY